MLARLSEAFTSSLRGSRNGLIARAITLLVIMLLLWLPAFSVFAQVKEPDSYFDVQQVEVYRNVLEIGDQLYLITGRVEYTMHPIMLSSQTYIIRLMDGVTELGSTTFYPYHNSGYDYGVASIYFSAADALAWSGAYTVQLQGNPTLHWLDTTAITAMDSALAFDTPVYTDETTGSNSAAANDMTLLPAAPAVDDAYYFGSSGMFDTLTVNIGQNGAWTGTYVWEYWDGDEWKDVDFGTAVDDYDDYTIGFTAGTGFSDVYFICPTDWQRTTVSGSNLYWLRFRVVTYSAIVTQPLGTQSWTNTLATPPSTENSSFSLWYDDDSVASTVEALTLRLRTLAQLVENDWGSTTDLVETVAGIRKLTEDGEDYFVNVIPGLRLMCPDLFSDILTTPDFDDAAFVQDFYAGGDDATYVTYGVNWWAQTFTTQSAYDIRSVELKMLRLGAPGNVTASIRATAGDLPTGADLASGTIDGDTFTTGSEGEWYEVSFDTWATGDRLSLAYNTTYAIVVRVIGGNAANYSGWRADLSGSYTGGYGCRSIDSGATWFSLPSVNANPILSGIAGSFLIIDHIGVAGSVALIAGADQDFLFVARAQEGYSLSYRNKLAVRLIDTPLDMTNNPFGLSRMWMTGMVWMLFACLLPTAFLCRAANSFKPAMLVFTLMLPMGALAGFLYLEIAIVTAFLCATSAVYVYFYRGAP